MTASRILQPATVDPDAKLHERMAAMEARLAALETKRDVIITPLGGFIGSGADVQNTQYFWRGGKLWILFWAEAVNLTGTSQIIGVQLVLAGTPIGFNSQIQSTGSPPTLPTVPASGGLTGAFWTPGQNNSIGFTRNNTGTNNWTASGILFEWPQA